MKLERLRVDRLNDLPSFELTGLSPRLNLLVGPNGSGKSSVMRVLRACLWPALDGGLSGPHVRSVWRLGEREIGCALDPDVRWYDAGGPVDGPDVPPAELAACWTVGLPDLLEASPTQGERDLLHEVRTLMAGGFDLPSVRADFAPLTRPGRRSRARLDAARKRLRAVQTRRAQLAEQEDGLAALESELEAAAEAQDLARAATDALELLEARDERQALEETLARFPQGMDEVGENDLRTFDRLVERRDVHREKRTALEREVLDLRRDLEAITLPSGPADEAGLEAARTRLGALERLADRRAELARELAAARQVEAAARAALGAEDGAPNLDDAALRTLDDWLRRRHEVRTARETAELRLESTGAARTVATGNAGASAAQVDSAAVDPRALHAALARLDDWLRAPAPRPRWLRPLAGLLMVAGAVGAWLLTPWASAAAGLGAGLWLAAGRGSRARDAARRGWPPAVVPPAPWDLESVRRRRESVAGEIADVEVREREVGRLRVERERAESELRRARAEEEVVAEEGASLAGRLGLRLPEGTVRPLWLVDRLLEWARSAAQSNVAEARLEAAEREFLASRTAFVRWLERWGSAPALEADVAALAATFDRLASDSLRWRELTRRRGDADHRRETAVESVRQIEEDLAAFVARLGLAGTDSSADVRSAVAERVGALAAHGEAKRALASAHTRIQLLERGLEGHPELLDRGAESLRARLTEAQARAAERDALSERVGKLRGALELERTSSEFEDALAEVEAATAALDAEREDHLHRVAADLLLEDVAHAHAASAMPAVFERMVDLFQGFTHHRYTLEVPWSEGGGWFGARDARTGQLLRLAELSDGTRMQLRLAARLAFAESQERGAPLPLVLDESLTATDGARFRAVAESLLALEDRQVFYLTSNEGDVHAWQDVAAEAGVALRVLRLGEAQRHANAAPAEALAVAPPQIPSPDGRTPEEYGALIGVPLPDPWAAAGALPLLHLLRDRLELFHRLAVEYRVETCGALTNLLDHLDRGALEDPVLTGATRRMLRGRLAVAARTLEAWRVGRGRPLTADVVLESEALTRTYHPAVGTALETLAGDAARFLDAIRGRDEALGFKGMHGAEKRADALEAVLESKGHLDRRPRLPLASILTAAAEAAGELPPTEARELAETLVHLVARSGPDGGAASADRADASSDAA